MSERVKDNRFKTFFSHLWRNIKHVLKRVGKWFIYMLTSKHNKWFVPVFAIFLGFIISMIIMSLTGVNPFSALVDMLRGVGLLPKVKIRPSIVGKEMLRCFMEFLSLATPMLFAALAVIVALKAGLFNIGVSGQMLVSGFIASMVGYVAMPSFVHKIAVLIVGIVMGGMYAALVGFLKYKFNINEVVSTIMLNYIGMYLVTYFIKTFFLNPINRCSIDILPSARWLLTGVSVGGYAITIPIALFIAAAAVVAIKLLFDKTKLGFEIRAVGTNGQAAKYAGINVGKNIVIAMLISGCLAGAAGVSYFLGYANTMSLNLVPTMGFDAIAVALLGASSPIGCVFATLLITAINYGSSYMQIQHNALPQQIAGIIVAILLLFAACGEFIKHIANKKRVRMEEAGAEFLSFRQKKNRGENRTSEDCGEVGSCR